MTVQNPSWLLRELISRRDDTSAQITVVCKGKCFRIQLSPEYFCQSPLSLKTYTGLIESVYSDEDSDLAEAAEEKLQHWALEPFLSIFNQIDTASSHQPPFTLHDYLTPETYRYQLYVVNEHREARFDYSVPQQPWANGVDLRDFALHPNWRKFSPTSIEICVCDRDDGYSQLPTKVLADGTMCFFKLLDHSDRRAAFRELEIYKRMETLSLTNTVRVPRLIGVVPGGQSSSHTSTTIIGLLLSWVDCNYRTLECALGPKIPLTLRTKWHQQITTTLACLHKAQIIWGDAKAANVLIDHNQDAWIVDFGGGYTQGWVAKEHMETIQGD